MASHRPQVNERAAEALPASPLARREMRAWRPAAALSLLLTGAAAVWNHVRSARRSDGDWFGLLLMIASAAAFALMAALAKLFLPHTPTQAVVLSRGVLMTAVFIWMARRRRVSLLGTRPDRLFLRGLLGYGAVSCYFWSVQHLPIGDAVLLQYSHPVFVAALAPLLLGERTGRWHWQLVIAACAGVALVVRPSGDFRAEALVGLCGSALSGLAYMTVRDLSRTEHPLTILVWFPAVTIPGALIGTAMAGAEALPKSWSEAGAHLIVTACALLGQLALTAGLARAGAARATAVTMTGPVFGFLFGMLFFSTLPTRESAAGTLLILAALILLALNRPRPA